MAAIFTYFDEFSGQLLLVIGAVYLTTYYLYRRHGVSDDDRKLPPAIMRGSKGGRTGRAPPFSLEGIFLTLIIFAQGSK